MNTRQERSKKALKKAGNVLFIGLLLVFVFNPEVKSWFLRRLMDVGLFNAEIKKEVPASNSFTSLTSFSFRDVKGNIVTTADLKGKVVFINFWATWCPPCRAEMPALNNLYNQLKDDDLFVFLFLNEDNDPAKGAAYLQSNGFAMPLMTAVGNVPSDIYSGTLPTTIVLNKDSKIVFRHEGLANYNTTEFINQLKALL